MDKYFEPLGCPVGDGGARKSGVLARVNDAPSAVRMNCEDKGVGCVMLTWGESFADLPK